ncbi:MAG TPA: site-2 protease family protein [Thermomicrobiales bacterium]|nr:site-2 protease family protein [Thermomicrobiales bacterium]
MEKPVRPTPDARLPTSRVRPRLFGIPLVIHPSWVLAAGLVVIAIGTGETPDHAPVSRLVLYLGGAVVAALLFVSVLVHELAHALVARRCALPVQRITIYFFGGAAEVDADALAPGPEALMSAAGPLASGLLALLFGALWWLARGGNAVLVLCLEVLALANAAILLLTALPGYPLDGGRIVRALIWYLTDDLVTATRLASLYGQFLAWSLLFGGLLLATQTIGPTWGLALVLCGWLLRGEARKGYHDLLWQQLSKRLPAYHAAFLRPPRIPADRTVEDAVDDILEGLGAHNEGGPSLVVDAAGAPLGVIGLDQLRAVKRACWPETPVGAVMVPRDAVPAIPEDTPLDAALRLLTGAPHGYGLVVGAGSDAPAVGVVTKTRIVNLLMRKAREGAGQLRDAAPPGRR